MAENIIKNEVLNHGAETEVKNWISQINAGGTVYDIATHHGITFKDGKGDGTGVKWNGLTDLEIVIPNITDIVQTPIEFAGTVDKQGIHWSDGHTAAEKGCLVFVTEDCTFEGNACEAGDMAIYDGSKWNIVSGENQVQLVGEVKDNKVSVLIGNGTDVLDVEGKTLNLAIDYAELDKHVDVDFEEYKGETVEVDFGAMKVGEVGITLSQAAASKKTIADNIVVKEASKLSNGEVTITGTDNLLTGVNFGTFNPGAMPEIVKNNDAKDFNVTGGSLSTTASGPFLTEVTLGNVTFDSAKQGDTGAFALVGGIAASAGKAFLTGIDGQAEFSVDGGFVPDGGVDAKFVTGLAGGVTDVVTDITAGSLTFDSAASDFITGLTDNVNEVVTAVSATAKNDTSVLNEAKVENHVLTFGSVNVASGVDVQTTTKSFTKGGYAYTAPSATKKSFTTSGFTKASDRKYTFDTDNETTYATTSSYYKITTPALGTKFGGYELNNSGMKITVAANTFAVDMTAGTLPTYSGYDVVRGASLSGSVATDLDITDKTVRQVAAAASEIEIPGAYTIVNGKVGDAGVVTVGAAGELAAKSAEVDLSDYITGVSVNIGTSAVR